MPLLIAPDSDYPMRSRYTTLFEALGRSRNAPVVQGMFAMVETFGSTIGYSVIAGVVGLTGLLLGWIGIQFGKLKDQLFDQLGLIKYAVVMGLFLMMMAVLGKIALRLLFGIKYIMSFPGVNFNI